MEGDVGGGGGRGDEECDEGAGKVAEGGSSEDGEATSEEGDHRTFIEYYEKHLLFMYDHKHTHKMSLLPHQFIMNSVSNFSISIFGLELTRKAEEPEHNSNTKVKIVIKIIN